MGKHDDASPLIRTGAYAFGGFVEAVTLMPIDTIKTRMQLAGGGGIISTGAEIVKKESVGALWKGVSSPYFSIAGRCLICPV
jgi:solute carrier family 25 oxoglutarate transporter 11